MLKIRLTRLGAKKAPFYRIVVADARAPRTQPADASPAPVNRPVMAYR